MINILPQPQAAPNVVARIDPSIAVTTLRFFVVLS
jgi:hypothetical protein